MSHVNTALLLALGVSWLVLAGFVRRVYELEDQVDALEDENRKLRGWGGREER